MRLVSILAMLLGTFVLSFTARAELPVQMITDEAEAVLSILDKLAEGSEVSDHDWTRLFESEPYIRLKKREAAVKRDFTDEEFREFVLSGELRANASRLRATLDSWSAIDMASPVETATAYLPAGSVIRAKVYPVIKPKSNSFVFEVTTDPAIFMYLDPDVTRDKLENTLAHELHHIGFGSNCPSESVGEELDAMPDNISWVVRRLGAFGEGFAMLAAAGGPEIHPQEASPVEQRRQWDEDVGRYVEDFRRVETFLEGAVDGTLSEEEKNAQFRSFYGEQGPWYTVGWKMSVTIEEELGRPALLESFCDTRKLLGTYNRAASMRNQRGESPLPLWSDRLVKALGEARGDAM